MRLTISGFFMRNYVFDIMYAYLVETFNALHFYIDTNLLQLMTQDKHSYQIE